MADYGPTVEGTWMAALSNLYSNIIIGRLAEFT